MIIKRKVSDGCLIPKAAMKQNNIRDIHAMYTVLENYCLP
jgi:hypothetical protein